MVTSDSLDDELIAICESSATESQQLRSRVVELMVYAEHEVARRVDADIELRAARQRIVELESQLHQARHALAAVQNSRTMRATAPLRRVYHRVRRR